MDLISLKKPLKEDQVNGMHSLNQENIPEVGDVSDLVDFQLLLDFSEHILCFKDKGVVIGFVLCMREGQSYQSENYKYLTSRFSNFLYIDRIAIKKEYRRRGLGEKIYLELVSIAEKLGLDILCEVNTRPRNDASLLFHEKMGFEEIGTNDFEKNSVMYLRKET
ncbi:MAG TPA: GNAT family N-acetyltransferase [Gammaproteobacteria bacterium]|nr:GNAT family N-acetyltransferase [Gammaproteobacteria bacterium]